MGKNAIAEPGQQHGANDRFQSRWPDPKFPRGLARGPEDFARDGLRLIDRGDGLHRFRQAAARPGELRRINGRQLHHRDANTAAVMFEFAAQRIRKAADGEFRSAIRRLQRDCSVTQGRADLHDGAAIAGAHALESRHGPVDLTEVSDLGHTTEFVGFNVADRREDGHHRVIDPNVDWAQFRLDPSGSRVERCHVGNIDRNG